MTMNRDRPSFTANACLPETTRTCGGEVFVEVTHWPSSTTYMLTASEAQEWALKLLEAIGWERGFVPSARPESEPARPVTCPHCGGPAYAAKYLPNHTSCDRCQRCWPDFQNEPTRKQCRKCLKDCAACSCVEDVISRGKGV